MMKSEFEVMVCVPVSVSDYDMIEVVYMFFDKLFPTKQDVAMYYQRCGMPFISALYQEVVSIQQREGKFFESVDSIQRELANLKARRYSFTG